MREYIENEWDQYERYCSVSASTSKNIFIRFSIELFRLNDERHIIYICFVHLSFPVMASGDYIRLTTERIDGAVNKQLAGFVFPANP